MSDAAQLIRAFDADPASDWPLRSVAVGLVAKVGATLSSSVDPMSHAPAGRVIPRWSLPKIGAAAHVAASAVSMIGFVALAVGGEVGPKLLLDPHNGSLKMSFVHHPTGRPT